MLRLLSKVTKYFVVGYCLIPSQQRYAFSHYHFSQEDISQSNLINDLLLKLPQLETENDKQALFAIYKKLTFSYTEIGDYQKATVWWEKFVRLAESILGPSYPKLEIWFINLGKYFISKVNPQKAIEYFEKASKIQITKYEEQSREVAETFTNLAYCYLTTDEMEKAEQALKKACNYMRQHENSGHLSVAEYFLYSGTVASQKYELENSIENYQKSRKIFENASGKYSTEIETIDVLMANIYCNVNLKEDAKLCYQSAINIREHLWIYDLSLYTNLILLLAELGNNKEIDETAEKAVKVIQSTSGNNSIAVAKFYLELSQNFQASNQPEMSSKFISKIYETLENTPHQNSQEIATLYEKIATEFAKTQDNEKIINCLEKILAIKTNLGIPLHNLVSNWYSLGIAYFELKDYENAEGYLWQAKEILEQDNSDMIALVESLNFLTTIYREYKEYATAADLFKKAILIKCQVLGKNYPELAVEYGELGMIYELWGKISDALECFWTAIEINNETLGDDNLPNASLYLHIGDVNFDIKKYEYAIEYHKKSIDVRRAAFGDQDKCIGLAYCKLAHDYKQLENWDMAEEHYKKGIEIDLWHFEDNEIYGGLGYFYLGNMYETKGDIDAALESYKIAESIYLRCPKYNREDLMKIQIKIEELDKSA